MTQLAESLQLMGLAMYSPVAKKSARGASR